MSLHIKFGALRRRLHICVLESVHLIRHFFRQRAALVPKPRVNLTRFYGVFAPNSKHRVHVTPAKRGKKADQPTASDTDRLDKSPEQRHRAMTWMQRLKRVFNIDIDVCEYCGGHVKVIASIEDPAVIGHILKHLKQKADNTAANNPHTLPPERAPHWLVRPIADASMQRIDHKLTPYTTLPIFIVCRWGDLRPANRAPGTFRPI